MSPQLHGRFQIACQGHALIRSTASTVSDCILVALGLYGSNVIVVCWNSCMVLMQQKIRKSTLKPIILSGEPIKSLHYTY